MLSVSVDEKPQHDVDDKAALTGLDGDERDHVSCRHNTRSARSVKASWLTDHSPIPPFFPLLKTFTPRMPTALSQKRRPGSTAKTPKLRCPRA
jgi:hypothetical protein